MLRFMAVLHHELWAVPNGKTLVCLAGPEGDGARRFLEPGSTLIWTFDAGSYFEAMTLYYEHMGWGAYRTTEEWDYQPYPEKWFGV